MEGKKSSMSDSSFLPSHSFPSQCIGKECVKNENETLPSFLPILSQSETVGKELPEPEFHPSVNSFPSQAEVWKELSLSPPSIPHEPKPEHDVSMIDISKPEPTPLDEQDPNRVMSDEEFYGELWAI